MQALVTFLICFVRNLFRSLAEIKAENVALRQQLNVILRTGPKVHLKAMDPALFVSIVCSLQFSMR